MNITVEAIYENGILRPLSELEGVEEHDKVVITIEKVEPVRNPLLKYAGIMSDEEAREINQIIEDEFGRIDPNGW